MTKERNSIEKTISELKDLINHTKRRRTYSNAFEKEVRTIISRLHVVADKKTGFSSLQEELLPSRLPVNWFQKQGEKYFGDKSFLPEDYLDSDIEELRDYLFKELNQMLETCLQVVKDCLFELEQFKKIQKPIPKLKSIKPEVVKVEKLTEKETKLEDKYLKKTIPTKFRVGTSTFIESQLNFSQKEFVILIVAMFIGLVIGLIIGIVIE